MFLNSFRQMQIFLINVMGTSFPLDVCTTDSVEDVKKQIKVGCFKGFNARTCLFPVVADEVRY